MHIYRKGRKIKYMKELCLQQISTSSPVANHNWRTVDTGIPVL